MQQNSCMTESALAKSPTHTGNTRALMGGVPAVECSGGAGCGGGAAVGRMVVAVPAGGGRRYRGRTKGSDSFESACHLSCSGCGVRTVAVCGFGMPRWWGGVRWSARVWLRGCGCVSCAGLTWLFAWDCCCLLLPACMVLVICFPAVALAAGLLHSSPCNNHEVVAH